MRQHHTGMRHEGHTSTEDIQNRSRTWMKRLESQNVRLQNEFRDRGHGFVCLFIFLFSPKWA